MTLTSIRPGQPWLDTAGNRIQAHGGSVLHDDGVFYWYGENKEHSHRGSGIWHWGVRCYSSTDLYNWHDEGVIIPPTPEDPSSPLHPGAGMDRPHIIKNPHTGKYVCWIKVMGEGDASTQLSTVLVADSLLGPYKVVHEAFRPLGMNAGDFDLVVEPTDGKAYYYFERVHSELICADLTADYTDVTGYYSTHFPQPQPPFVREAPAHFRRGSQHYLITSGTSGYFPNPSEAAVAPSYHGPWQVLGDTHPDDDSRTSYRSQLSSVFKHPHKKDLYIAIADRWLPTLPAERSNQTELFRRMFAGEDRATIEADAPDEFIDPDTSIADYVWLPITFDGDRPLIHWHDEWRIEDFD
ncbi:family 43 glycosylhydrolase [Streptomyces sp. NPDC090106]|uniref:family 43 glycosylhydrolase n=1 Tax=Streptomyces sp. NPDC090106 TaxID=3365946 RepID=UPI00380EC17B